MAKLNLISLASFSNTDAAEAAPAPAQDLMAQALAAMAPKRGGKEVVGKKPSAAPTAEEALRDVLAEAEKLAAAQRAAEKLAAERAAAQRAAEDTARAERAVAAIAQRQLREVAATEAVAILERDAQSRRERDETLARIRAIGGEIATLRGVAKTLRLQGNRLAHELAERKIELLRAEELRLRARLDGFGLATALAPVASSGKEVVKASSLLATEEAPKAHAAKHSAAWETRRAEQMAGKMYGGGKGKPVNPAADGKGGKKSKR